MTGSKGHRQSQPLEMRRRAASGGWLLAILVALPAFVLPSARAQTFTVLHKFSGGRDGSVPAAGVVPDAAGNIYGVTEFGGSFNFGTAFEVDAAGKETVLHNFLGGEGLWPLGGLIRDAAGNLYGTTSEGGTPKGGGCKHGCGTVFMRDKTSGKQTVLYAFTGGADGRQPNATLIRDAAGNLYGTTLEGGSFAGECQYESGCGVVFKLNMAGKETVLYRFTDGTDGSFPQGVVRDGTGNLYGTTRQGGTSENGDVFKLDHAGKMTLLYSFTGGADGKYPEIYFSDKAGNLYGTTGGGGLGFGAVFKLDTAGKLTVLHNFTGGSDGKYPDALISDKADNLYGTAAGGVHGHGVVFKLDTTGTETVLHSFNIFDGDLPNGLIMDGAGNLYGTTLAGGKGHGCSYKDGCGTVFKLTP